jgi:DNA-binding SARP family transcriptional activator
MARKGRSGSAARIFLLGGFAVEVSDQPIPASAWKKRRPVELLAALALAPGRMLHREELIDRLWPDKDLEAGANNLHRALFDLRRIAGAELAALDRGVLRLAEAVWIDVDAFERAATSAASGDLSEAVTLYRGALLPDDPYSDALATRREGLRQRFVDAGLRLAQLHHEGGEPDRCIDVLRKVLVEDPAIEPAHRLLMTVLAETGRTGDALRQFAECTSALRSRFDVAPAKATADLRAAIERGQITTEPTTEPTRELPSQLPSQRTREAPPQEADASVVTRRLLGDASRPLYGRAAEVERIRAFVAGGPGVLLLVGEAGLGKTRLATECARTAAKSGGAVLVGVGLDHDSGVPYAPFADAWAQRRRASGGEASVEDDPFLSFAPSGGSAQEDRLRLFQSVERSLANLGRDRSVCLVVEDLHQADPSSLHLFHHLARATRSLPLLLVGSLRDDEVHVGQALHALLGNLGRERLGTRIVLERFDLEATGQLVRDLLDESGRDADPDVVAQVYELAEGNPFHTEEVVETMRDPGNPRPSVPKNLLETVRARVRRLGRDAERLLTAAALLGLRFPFETAHAAAGLSAESALDALELGIEARIVEEHDGEYRFRHALTQKALLDALTHARRVYLHRAIAEALEAQGETRRVEHAEILSRHHEGAGQLERALPYLLLAGERAQRRLGFSEAVAFFERALDLMDATGRVDGAERFRILRTLGGIRMALSDLDGAVRDLDAAATAETDEFRPSATQRALVRRVAALALIQGGRLTEAGERLEEAEAALTGSTDDPELSPVLYLLAQLRWHQEKYAEARTLAQRSLAEAEARGDRAAMAKGHEMLALACHSLGAWQEGHAHETERQALADGSLDVDQAFDVHLCLWEYHLYGDQQAIAIRTAVDQMLAQAQRMKAPRAIALCENFAGTVDFLAGRWDEAERQLRGSIQGFRLVGSASGEALSLQRLAVLLTAKGELDEARRLLDEGIVVGERAAMRSHCLTRLYASLARNRLAAGDHEGAQASLAEGLAEAARHGNCSTCSSLLLPEAVRVELATGNVRGAEAHARELADVARRFESRAWTAMAEMARGRVAAARGERTRAEEALERARRAYEDIGSRYEAARCALAQSRLAGSKNELADAARRTFDELGAAGLET